MEFSVQREIRKKKWDIHVINYGTLSLFRGNGDTLLKHEKMVTLEKKLTRHLQDSNLRGQSPKDF